MNKETLKFPTIQPFTHSDLAAANNCKNSQVWVRYQQAIKDGIIVSAGERKNPNGKGKPSRLWKLADGQPIPLLEIPKAISDVVKVVKTSPPKLSLPKIPIPTKPKGGVVEIGNAILEVKEPYQPAPIVAALVSEPEVESEIIPVVVRKVNIIPEFRQLKDVCPICDKPLFAWNDSTGVMVQCNQPLEICPVHENCFGHGKNEKEAYHILCQKYQK